MLFTLWIDEVTGDTSIFEGKSLEWIAVKVTDAFLGGATKVTIKPTKGN